MRAAHRARPIVAVLAVGTALGVGTALPASAAPVTPATAPMLAPFYTELDLTGDAMVTVADLDVVAAGLGAVSGDAAWNPIADVDGDGILTVADLAAVSGRMIYDDGPFELVEASLVDMQAAMNAGVITSADLTSAYLERIDAYDTRVPSGGRALNSVITASTTAALTAAAEADAVRAEEGMTSLLLGIPVGLKDNIDTFDLPTTAGCACWETNQTTTDATIAAALREAGAVIVAKTSLDEFAFGFVSEFSAFLPGPPGTVPQTTALVASPYVTTQSAGGSSGGTGAAVAASLVAVGFGTDTGGSIRVPSSYNQLVGIRPTVGLVSRSGIVPLALSQDTAGPLGRSVTDAAVALDAVVGVDGTDPVTQAQAGLVPESYTASLDAGALDGARIGYVPAMVGTNPTTVRLFQQALADLEDAGAVVVPVTPPSGFAAVLAEPSGSTNEFRHDLDAYIAANLDPAVPYRSLQEIIDSGRFVTGRQGSYVARAAVTDETYEGWAGPDGTHTLALAAGKELVTGMLDDAGLDALVYPSTNPYASLSTNMRLSPNTGMPAVTVPMGQATPEDGTIAGAGVNLELLGRDFDEGGLLGLAFAYEQATQHRVTPTGYGPLG